MGETKDLETTAGTLYLVHEDYAVLKYEYELLCDLENYPQEEVFQYLKDVTAAVKPGGIIFQSREAVICSLEKEKRKTIKMRVICIDDEYLILQRTVTILRRFPQVENVEGFLNGEDALEYLKNNSADAAFLDINMPDINGLELAQQIREQCDNIELVFLTGYNEFALDAFKVHASGYLIKPVEEDSLLKEIQNIERIKNNKPNLKVTVITFGNFDVLVDGNMIAFPRTRSKEILAYLVTKKGTGVSRAELASVLWEDELYDHGKQKQLDVYIRSLNTTLKENGIEKIIQMSRGILRIVPEMIDCDYYKYLEGDPGAVSSYVGEFMDSYSWAEYLKDVFM